MKYWLLKTEPDEWSWKDQVEKNKKGAVWDGVENTSEKISQNRYTEIIFRERWNGLGREYTSTLEG